jgi:CheY-like chemotaxis protein
VVDDLSTNLSVAKGLLAPYGLTVDTAISGFEAIEKLRAKNKYDIVFMDHMMPRMDGIETTTRIRALGSKQSYFGRLPIIALTANAVVGTKEMFISFGFNDYLSKPIDITELNTVLEKWIPKKKQEETKNKSDSSAADITIQIEGLDTALGIAQTGGTMHNYLTILAMFYKDCLKMINEINAYTETSNISLYTAGVHAMKGMLAGIGSEGLSKAAEALEAAGRDGDEAYINIHTAAFINGLQDLLQHLHPVVSGFLLEYKNEKVDSNGLETKLSDLKTAIEQNNAAAVEQAVKELEKFNKPGDTGGDITMILQLVSAGAYVEAVMMIECVCIQYGYLI